MRTAGAADEVSNSRWISNTQVGQRNNGNGQVVGQVRGLQASVRSDTELLTELQRDSFRLRLEPPPKGRHQSPPLEFLHLLVGGLNDALKRLGAIWLEFLARAQMSRDDDHQVLSLLGN